MSVCPSVCSSFDFNEIWHVGRGRWVMHDVMQYDLIQGQGQGHEPFKVGNLDIFKSYLLRHLQWGLAIDHWFWNYGTVSKFDQPGFFYIWPNFCVTWLWFWQKRHLRGVDCQFRTVLFYFKLVKRLLMCRMCPKNWLAWWKKLDS